MGKKITIVAPLQSPRVVPMDMLLHGVMFAQLEKIGLQELITAPDIKRQLISDLMTTYMILIKTKIEYLRLKISTMSFHPMTLKTIWVMMLLSLTMPNTINGDSTFGSLRYHGQYLEPSWLLGTFGSMQIGIVFGLKVTSG